MDPPSQSIQGIFLRDDDADPNEDRNEAKRNLVTLAHGEPAKKRRRCNSRKPPAQWDEVKADVKKLYVDEDRSLGETMTELRTNRGFEASKDQFKSKIKEWKFDKKVKAREMKHILCIETRRLPKKTAFKVRNQPVSRFKIERFKKRQSACPEPPSRTPSVISFNTSYSTEGTPSPNLTVSPRLGNVDWYRSYGEYRNNPPEYSFHPVVEKLQKLRIQETTYERRMFNKSKRTEFYLLVDDVLSQNLCGKTGIVPYRRRLYDTFLSHLNLYDVCQKAYEDDPSSLFAEPNLQWWVSEISRELQSRVESISTGMISEMIRWSFDHEHANAVDVFYEVGLELCRTKKWENWYEIHCALDMVDFLILHGRFRAGKTLSRAIFEREIHIRDKSCRNDIPDWSWLDQLKRSNMQLTVIQWFLAHPHLTRKTFGENRIPKISLGKRGKLQVDGRYYCFPRDEDLLEMDDVIQDLESNYRDHFIDGVRRRCVLRNMSRYLPTYGESIFGDENYKGSVREIEAEDDDEGEGEEGTMSDERGTAPETNLVSAIGTSFTRPHLEENTLNMDQEDLGWTALGSQRQPSSGPGGPPSVFDCEFSGLPSGGSVAQTGQLGTEGEGTRTNVEPSFEEREDPFLGNLMSPNQWDDLSFEQITQAGFVPEEARPVLGPEREGTRTHVEPSSEEREDLFLGNLMSPNQWDDLSFEHINQAGFMPEETQPILGPSADYQNAPSNFMPIDPEPQVGEQVPDWNFNSEQIPGWDFDDEQTRMNIDPEVGF
ncbi:MAG: hypothetical protein Q9213_001442 [Squamulea squamosa]